ncbi:MAG: cupin domain-containing protein [Thermodesulfobacteriota bacterium]
MARPIIIRLEEVSAQPIPGAGPEAGFMKRVLYPPRIETQGLFFAYCECRPGFSPHRWHTHQGDQAEGYRVEYPPGFEEVYYVIRGQGVMQWERADGVIAELPVGPGDAVFIPPGVPRHQLLNNGPETIQMIGCGQPRPKVTLIK